MIINKNLSLEEQQIEFEKLYIKCKNSNPLVISKLRTDTGYNCLELDSLNTHFKLFRLAMGYL